MLQTDLYMVIGVVLTILEFREIPEEQPPVYDSVAAQAQPVRED